MFRSNSAIAHQDLIAATHDFENLTTAEMTREMLSDLQAAHAELGEQIRSLAEATTP